MSPDSDSHRARARAVFLEALDVPRARRAAFVAERCGDDAELQRTVLELFLLHGDEDSVLDHSPDPTPALDALAASAGRTFGPYLLGRELGRGGMGVVHLAYAADSPAVALKLLAPGMWTQETRERFRLEAEILQRLSHPGIARLLAAGEEPRADGHAQPWLAMEYVEGVTIAAFAASHARTDHERVRLLLSVCEAVQHAHERGIVHRDLKPSNILVRPDGTPVVLDFGVARTLGGDERPTELATRTGQLVGTPQYMSPEQVQAESSGIGPASDVYSLGVLAYELLAGRRPYDATSVSLHRAVVSILTAEPAPLGQVVPRFRGPLERVIGRALEKLPQDRYADAGGFGDDLARWLGGRTVRARGPNLARRARRWSRARRRLVVALSAVVFTASIALPWWLATKRGPTDAEVRAAYRDAEQRVLSAIPILYEQERTPASMQRAVNLLEGARDGLAPQRRLRHRDLLDLRIAHELGTAQLLLGQLTWDVPSLRQATWTLEGASLATVDTLPGWDLDSPLLRAGGLRSERRDEILSLLSFASLSLHRIWGQRGPLVGAVIAQENCAQQLMARVGPPRPAGVLTSSLDANDPWALFYNNRAEVLAEWAAHGHSPARAEAALLSSDSALARRVAFAPNPPAMGSLYFVRGTVFRVRGEITGRAADFDSSLFWLKVCLDYRRPARPVVHAETREGFARTWLEIARRSTQPRVRLEALRRARHEVDTAQVMLRGIAPAPATAALALLESEILCETASETRSRALLERARGKLDQAASSFGPSDYPRYAARCSVVEARLALASVRLGLPGASLATAAEALERARQGVAQMEDSLLTYEAAEVASQAEGLARAPRSGRRPH